MKNVSQGRAHYVSFAVTTGYRSINWAASDQLGHTALHVAVTKGHVTTVEELLKYKADANLRSGIGNFPIHDAWVFWRSDCSSAMRLEQEAKTTAILHLLLSYGANVDGPMNDGTTALHIAARLGPLSAVKELLGFKANHHARDHSGFTPMGIAADHGNAEILRLLVFWDGIKKQMINVDFVVQWRHFLSDYEAVIASMDNSVENLMFELNMRENMRKQDQRKLTGIRVDDPFLLKCKHASTMAQKLRNRADATEEDCPPPSSPRADDASEQSYEPGNWRTFLNIDSSKAKVFKKKKIKTPVQEYYQSVFDRNIAPTPKLDEMKNKFRRAESVAMEAALATNTAAAGDREGEESEEENDDFFSSSVVENVVGAPAGEGRPVSKLQERRLNSAAKVILDAKFDMFTARPSTSSALGLSRRTALAPLQGTPEEYSMARYLTTPTRTRRLIAQGVHDAKREGKSTYTAKCQVSTLGSYSHAVSTIANPSQRQLLYDQIVDNNDAKAVAAAANMDEVAKFKNMGSQSADSWRGTKVDMNPTEKRSLFVAKDLVPPKRELNALQELRERLKAQHLSGEAESDDVGKEGGCEKEGSHAHTVTKKEQQKHQKEARSKKVVYGEGRVTSTHMVKRQVQVPWSTVNSRYNISTPI